MLGPVEVIAPATRPLQLTKNTKMWRTAIVRAGGALFPSRMVTSRAFSSSTLSSSSVSTAVSSMILCSLKEHYTEVSKMTPPPKVSPPSPFTVVKGALDNSGPVLKRTYGDEDIGVRVMRLVNFMAGEEDDDGDDEINQLFLHVEVSKPGQKDALNFLCGLYPDALGIHSVSMREKLETSDYLFVPTKYNGPNFEALDDRMRDAFHGYIEERGIDHSLFPFLQAWLYVKDHRNLMRWFKSVGTFVAEHKQTSVAQ